MIMKSSESGAGRVRIRVYFSGRMVVVYRYFTDKSGKHAKFNTIGVYPERSIISALGVFESLAHRPDVVKVAKINGTLANLFDTHKADFRAPGERSYHHYITVRSTVTASALLPKQPLQIKSLQTI